NNVSFPSNTGKIFANLLFKIMRTSFITRERGLQIMTTTVLKVSDLISTSDKSWQDAVEKGLDRASKTIRNIKGIDVTNWKAQVENGKIIEYRAVMKLAFEVEQ
ncbi:MAG: dodecin family protein, partial [Thermoproteota archaeon]|nr:dodecin family protein [Thermoproteota archaeon]